MKIGTDEGNVDGIWDITNSGVIDKDIKLSAFFAQKLEVLRKRSFKAYCHTYTIISDIRI